MSIIIARDTEKRKLKDFFEAKEAGFLAIYGRRRVGKTFLIRNYFKRDSIYFELVGQKNTAFQTQLDNCYKSINEAFSPELPIKKPESWNEALSILTLLIKKHQEKKVVLFFDELPWLATRRSGLMEALDYEWNSNWSQIQNIKLVVCGSAASWMLDKLIHAKGGLYNRLTDVIHLKPFTLGESILYLSQKGIRLNDMQMLELYMVMGGIPHYLNQVKKGKSSAQNINTVCFDESELLFSEYNRLFDSLFDESEDHYRIIHEISKNGNSISRTDLLKKTGLTSGGGFKKKINELKMSGFVQEYVPFGKKSREVFYKIIDEYTLFFLQWIEPIQKRAVMSGANYWLNASKQPSYHAWTGYAFEAVCMKHIDQIIKAIGIETLAGEIGSWRYVSPKKGAYPGAQIDMVIARVDNSINLCEIKFSKDAFVITKEYAKKLDQKKEIFENITKTGKQIFLTMITTNGVKKNMYSEDLVDSEVKLNDLKAG